MQDYSNEMLEYIEAAFKDGKIERQEWDFLVSLAKSNSLSVDILKKDMIYLYGYYFFTQTGEITKNDIAKIKKLAELIDLPEAKSDLWLTKQIEEIETEFYKSVKEIKDTVLERFRGIYGYNPTGKYGKTVEDSSLTEWKRQDFIKSITPSQLNEYFAFLSVLKKLKEGDSSYEDDYKIVLKEARAKYPKSRMLYNKRGLRKYLIQFVCSILLMLVGFSTAVLEDFLSDLLPFINDPWFIGFVPAMAGMFLCITSLVYYSEKKYDDIIVIK